MRRSICFCEPPQALAGEVSNWTFNYTTASKLPKGTILRFDLCTSGREIDWEIPSANIKNKSNVIWAAIDDETTIKAQEIEVPDSYVPQFEFKLPKILEAGQTLTIHVGSPPTKGKLTKEKGTRAQTFSERRKNFHLLVDPSGKKQFDEPEVFTLDIKGNSLANLNILAPSFAVRNKRFDIVVRFEDEYGNLTSNAPEETLIELSYEQLRENLNWKLFVPETGFINLPNLYFNEAGIYTIKLKNTHTGDEFFSCPIKCFEDTEKNLFWGLLHGESVRVDSTENIENCMRHFRDEKALNFFASSPFEDPEETSNEIWKLINQNVVDFDEHDRYTTFLGFQYQGEAKKEGLRQFIWAKEGKPLLRQKDSKSSTLSKIYKSHTPKDLLSIPCFTMAKGFEYDFDSFNPEYERVVEIYNSWGSSECTKKEKNPRPIKGPAKLGLQESAEGSILRALKQNKRFGFVAGGLDDRGAYADLFEDGQEQYSPGITAIISSDHTRPALYDALYNRACYASTGPRIILGHEIAGKPMGSETSTAEKHGLNVNRHLTGYVAGSTKIQTVEIVRNGEVIKTFNPEGYHFNYTYDDLTSLKDVCINAKDGKPPFVFYYIRVTQEDGEMAWSSPIWIDYIPGKPTSTKAKTFVRSPKKVDFNLPSDDDDDNLDDDSDEDD